jgi:hypothetical protein
MSVIVQEPGVVQSRSPTPPASPGSPQIPNRQLTPLEPPTPPVSADASKVEQESHESLVERVREVVPDVLPAHVFDLLSIHEPAFPNNLLDVVIDILLEDRSYPKDLKGKAKARTSDKKTTGETSGDIDTGVDYSLLDANRRLGSGYRTLSWVRFGFPSFRTRTADLHDSNPSAAIFPTSIIHTSMIFSPYMTVIMPLPTCISCTRAQLRTQPYLSPPI